MIFIMATARGTGYDKVTGLDLGADDYLAKPFGMMEIISHMKAVLRRTGPKEKTNMLRIGNLELNLETYIVLVNIERILFLAFVLGVFFPDAVRMPVELSLVVHILADQVYSLCFRVPLKQERTFAVFCANFHTFRPSFLPFS